MLEYELPSEQTWIVHISLPYFAKKWCCQSLWRSGVVLEAGGWTPRGDGLGTVLGSMNAGG